MRHQNSVFHDVLKQIPWGVFDRLVEEHGSDDLVRKFTTRQHCFRCFSDGFQAPFPCVKWRRR